MKKSHSLFEFLVCALWLVANSFVSLNAGDDREATLLSEVRQITFEGKRSGEGYFNADGSQFVFQSERDPSNPFFQIYRLDLNDGQVNRVSPGLGKTTCAWFHPTRPRILFASTHEDPQAEQKQMQELADRNAGKERRYSWDYDERYDLYSADLSGGSLQKLTHVAGYDAEGSWSPDGEWIAFASNRHAYAKTLNRKEQENLKTDPSYFVDLYRMRSDGSQLQRLTDTPGYDGGPFFSADGKRICWRRFSEDGATAEIYTMNVDGTDQRQITRLGKLSWAPFYHPSGDYLIFSTNLHGFDNFELYLVDAQGRSDPRRVTYTEGFDGLPAFSPDGRTLAWTSNRTPNGQSQMFFAQWNDAVARRLLGLPPVSEATSSPPTVTDSEIRVEDLKRHTEFLASETTAGRLTGSSGERRAAEYLAAVLQSAGLQPAGDAESYLQAFEFTSAVRLGARNRLSLHLPEQGEARELELEKEWRPLAFSATGAIEPAPIVFAGYGIVAPEEEESPEYDSYAHLDVEDKWLLVFRGLPQEISSEHRQHLSRYASLRFKAMLARERGARGILFVSGPQSQVKEQLVRLVFDASQGTVSLAVLSVSDDLAAELLRSAGGDLGSVQKQLDAGEAVMGFEIRGTLLGGWIDIQQERKTAYNVLARLPAARGEIQEPALVLGAHFDHLGMGGGGNSLAKPEEVGKVHFGADDNASGTALLLEIAEKLAGLRRSGALTMSRDLLFGFWSGEELGLLGSSHFVETYNRDNEAANLNAEVAAYLNMDMVGRLREKLILQGVGSSSVWKPEIEKHNIAIGLPIVTQNDSYLPTDTTAFYLKKVPVLSAFTGLHSEYHTPRDTPDLLNYEGMVRIGELLNRIAVSLTSRHETPDYQEMRRPQSAAGRSGMRAYLGTIPDYAQTDIQGVKLSGVIAGGPAERAGVQAGDIIVELSGTKIENIYDYTYAIDALKIGESVDLIVLRERQRIVLEVIPESRN